MPNWVHTVMTAEGPSETLERFADEVAGASDAEQLPVPFTFQSIIPRPAEAEDDWYNWNVANWGTKWDACEAEQDAEYAAADGALVYRFDTAWSYPEPVFSRLTEQYPLLRFTFEYQEEQGWGGTFLGAGGRLTSTETYDIPQSHAEMAMRGVGCYCEFDSPVFPDCWSAAARLSGVDDPDVLEVVESLGETWTLSLQELVVAAQAVCQEVPSGRPS